MESLLTWGSTHALFAVEQTDLAGSVQQAWNSFVQSGQVWAIIIGFVLGYLFRSFTAY